MKRQSVILDSEKLFRQLGISAERSFPPFSAVKLYVDKGEAIASQGDECANYFYVISGQIRMKHIAPSGDEIILAHLGPGEDCEMVAASLLAGHSCPATAVAETSSSVILIPRKTFLDLFFAIAEFRQHVFNDMDNNNRQLLTLLDDVLFVAVAQRLARFLVNQSKKENPVHATHYEIANEIGTAREVVTRLLTRFEDKSLIRRARGEVWVDNVNAMEELAEDVPG